MNKKIFAIFALVLVAISITAVSAFDLGGLIGGDSTSEAQNVTLRGIDFTIPAGYDEDEIYAIDGEVNESSGVTYTSWGKTYENDDGDIVSLLVAEYDGVEVDDEMPAYIGSDKMTVNGVDGYKYDVDPFYGFTYAMDGKLVIITSNVKDVFDGFVVK